MNAKVVTSVAQDIWPLGVTRLFGTHDLHSTGLTSGWSHPEDGHIWNDGPEAVLSVTCEPVQKPLRLTVQGAPYLAAGRPFQDLTLYVNGARAAFWRLTNAGIATLEARIEPEHILTRQGKSVVTCAFHMPHATRPMDIGLGNDGRALGFCFHAMGLA